ncbi:alpha-(1,6)-fucosyltransferase isoform X2 [Lingula anatina]|nr:alpha-(1,6)-fucosyltransferase isoform X2 [Lingula anatina]|eukprot:XP_013397056.1 alpha-(1,6)-fucosyltransferase isoform X2 [Lingula anatina]
MVRVMSSSVDTLHEYLTAKLNLINRLIEKDEDKTSIQGHLYDVLREGREQLSHMVTGMKKLQESDGFHTWRQKTSRDLGALVQRRLQFLQNPEDCAKAKKIVCTLDKECGFGCQMHHLVYCLATAYETERTLILNSKGWRYASDGWETVFRPLSNTCTDDSGSSRAKWGGTNHRNDTQVIDLPILDIVKPLPRSLPLAVPEDILRDLRLVHGNPAVWWVGQLARYLFRLQPKTRNYISGAARKLNFHGIVVGVHIRRTDKITTKEATRHELDEYMSFVEDYQQMTQFSRPAHLPRVYLATDDPDVVAEARRKYPQYRFLNDLSTSKSASEETRYSEASLLGIIMDTYFLSRTNFLVCTFSSQVCRLAYELMQTHHTDASAQYRSLDDTWYFGGGSHQLREILLAHIPLKDGNGELKLEPGDLVYSAIDNHNGYSNAKSLKTGEIGLFPSYKGIWASKSVKLPTYPNATFVDHAKFSTSNASNVKSEK